MHALASFDYAVIRVVPRPEREEFINTGVILFCRTRRFLDARVELDENRLGTLAPGFDAADVRRYLDLIPLICRGAAGAGSVGRFSMAERFHWLVAPRSTVVQTSPVHSGLCLDPAATLDHLFATMVQLLPP